MRSVFQFVSKNKHLINKMAPTSHMHISVLGTGRPGTPKSILLCTDSTRYLVNCGEGTQRILTEHRSKASKIQHVFFTQMSWDYFSGLLGIALTVKTAGVKKMFVHGPPAASQLMKLTRHFADAGTTDVVQSNILETPFIDNDFKITAFEIERCIDDQLKEPSIKRSRLETPDTNRPIYAYFFQAYRVNNKLDPAKCIKMGIPAHIMRSGAIRQLIEGEPLMLEDGRMISPCDVTLSPPTPRNLLIIDCPSEAYIPLLLGADSLYKALSSPDEDGSATEQPQKLHDGIGLTVHFVPPGLFENPKYQQFVQSLEKHAQQIEPSEDPASRSSLMHLVLDGSSSCPPISGIFSQSTVLNKFFDSTLYPQLADFNFSKRESKISSIEPFSKVVYAEPMLKYLLRPNYGYSTEQCIVLDEQELLQQTFDPLYVNAEEASIAFKRMHEELAAALVKRTADNKHSRLENSEWPQFTFLGTASSAPSKYRNISGILVCLSADECILMDCGEGTLNQLYSMLGVDETHRLLRGLKLILITHMHADHHGGVLTIAKKVSELCPNSNLPVLAPPPFWKWTQSFADLFKEEACIQLFNISKIYISQVSPATTENLNFDDVVKDATPPSTPIDPVWRLQEENEDNRMLIGYWKKILASIRLNIGPVKVPHTGTSWGYVVERVPGPQADAEATTDTWKVVYSGDTPPCSHLAEAGRDCDLLIHEATMADGYEEQAVIARHSTTSEAVSIGRAMRAKFILLNHFSQRFSRLPNFDTFQEDIAPTFDFMRVKFGDLWKLAHFLPYYKYAFAKHWDMQQTRADARQCKRIQSDEALEETRKTVRDAVGR